MCYLRSHKRGKASSSKTFSHSLSTTARLTLPCSHSLDDALHLVLWSSPGLLGNFLAFFSRQQFVGCSSGWWGLRGCCCCCSVCLRVYVSVLVCVISQRLRFIWHFIYFFIFPSTRSLLCLPLIEPPHCWQLFAQRNSILNFMENRFNYIRKVSFSPAPFFFLSA